MKAVALRGMLRRTLCSGGLRRFSASSSLVMQRQENGCVSLQLSSAPVNGLSLSLCSQLISTLKELEEDSSVRGLIIGSAVNGIFSAGLDIKSLILTPDYTEEDLCQFWNTDLWLAIYMSPLATVAAISGHCPAGGCLLALSCDARVMAEGKYTIGLNEVKLGLVAPSWLSGLLKDTVGQRQAEWMLQLGKLVSPNDALAIGMVDKVVPLSGLHDASHEMLAQLLQVPDEARALAKRRARQGAAALLSDFRSEDLDAFLDLALRPSVQNALVAYLDGLKNKGSD
ncbi:hypothetical protein AB1Y20_008013 [Prymnesium parvum]|uniref:Enoyl-CoA delta isomerase 1, mitochondrial n=1 Tax=Prymnesium parvum TaxID=97485 RepID=A0AB34IVJ4_PRYPA